MITTASLKTQSWKDLADMAKSKGLAGWSSMRKDELVKALVRAAQKRAKLRESARAEKVSKTKPSVARRLPTAKSHAAHGKAHAAHAAKSNGVRINGKHIAKRPHNSKQAEAKPTNGHRHATAKIHGTPEKLGVMGKNGTASHGKPSHGKPSHNKQIAAPAVAEPRLNAKQQRIAERIHRVNAERERLKDLSGAFSVGKSGNKRAAPEKDRIVLMVRDSYWLQAIWTVTRHSVKRAEAALAEHWHTAGPVLRLLEVDSGHTTSTAERVAREIEVHGGVTNWYIEVNNPPHSFRVELGYKASNGRFFSICRSNIVKTPAPDSGDVIDENWTDVAANYERVYALSGGYNDDNTQSGELQELFEERLRRPMGPVSTAQFGSGAERVLNRNRDLDFHVDAEMILYGRTKPDAKVTLGGEPIKLRPDGSFTVRQPMPDKRQVLPVVASTPDGVEQRTIVIAVERNTKVLEPMMRESNE